MLGQGWAGKGTWVNRWGTQGFLGTIGSGSRLLPHLQGAGCRCRLQMQVPRTQIHCSTAKPGATSLPFTLPPATVFQSNKKAETATCLWPECFCWCLWLFPGFLPATGVGCMLTWLLTSAHGLLNLRCAWAKAGWGSSVVC